METKRTLINLLMNWGNYALSLIVLFFLSPYIVGKLDAVSYGIWTLLNVLVGHMGVLDLGVRSSVGRHIALYLGKDDAEALDETIRSGLGFFSLTGILLFAASAIVGFFFPEVFKGAPAEYHRTIQLLLFLMVFNVWLSAISAIYSSVLAAHDRFDLARLSDIIALIVRTACIVISLMLGMGLWGLAIAGTIGSVVSLIGNYILSHKQQKGLRSWPLLFSKKRFREITGYGAAAFFSRVSLKLIGQTDLLIAGALLSVASVREYSVGAMLVFYSGTFVGIIDNTLFPAIQRAVARNDVPTYRWLFIRQTRISILFAVPVFVGIAMFSEPFIRLWMLQPGFGEDSVKIAASVMMMLAIGKIPLTFVGGGVSLLSASGRIWITAGISFAEALLHVSLSVVLVKVFGWGLFGIAASSLMATLCLRAIWIPLLSCREGGISVSKFICELVFPALVAIVGFAAICYAVLRLNSPATWIMFSVDVAAVSLIFGLIGIPALSPKEYRQELVNALKRFRLRFIS